MESHKHFSHPHSLILCQPFQQGLHHPIQCSRCESPIAAALDVFSCVQCSYFLHPRCFHAKRFIHHPSHPSHPLTLMPSPTYPSASFLCGSCHLPGAGFSYACAPCNFDLHVHCAEDPLSPQEIIPLRDSYASSLFPSYLEHRSPVEDFTRPPNFGVLANKPNVEAVEERRSCAADFLTSNLWTASSQNSNNVGLVETPKELSGSGGQQQLMTIIHHDSHHKHPLCFLASPPYDGGEFTCDACGNNGDKSSYHCSICQYDLHAECTDLVGTAKREDHKHPLTLYYSLTQEQSLICDVCRKSMSKGRWCYYCTECDYGTHLDCVEAEAVEASEENGGHRTEDIGLMMLKLQHQMRMQSMLASVVSSSIKY